MMDHDLENDRLLWIDWETWGLGAFADIPLELGWCITKWDGSKTRGIVSHCVRWTDDVISSLPQDELFEPHRSNGIIRECESDSSIPIHDILASLQIDIRSEINLGHRVLMAGNSVHFDRERTISIGSVNGFKDILNGISHRMIDMSCILECYRAWNPEIADGAPEKKTNHRSARCLEDSLRLFRYWRGVMSA